MLRSLRTTVPAVLAVLLLSGCTFNPATGRQQLLTLSPDQEVALGTEAMPALVEEYGGEFGDAGFQAYVSEVGQRLVAQVEEPYRDLPWEFTVLDSEVINAFALPGGKVFVSRGLLQHLNNEAQLAAVLGHEIGHVTAQHIDERLSRTSIAQAVAAGVGAAAGQAESQIAQLVPALVGAGGQAYLLHFGRSQESEADWQGLKYMTAAGYEPTAMLQVIQILIDEGRGAGPPEFFSTHPNPETRYENVTGWLREQFEFAVGNPRYRAYEDRWERRARPALRLAGSG